MLAYPSNLCFCESVCVCLLVCASVCLSPVFLAGWGARPQEEEVKSEREKENSSMASKRKREVTFAS